jgi:hypothetical protein
MILIQNNDASMVVQPAVVAAMASGASGIKVVEQAGSESRRQTSASPTGSSTAFYHLRIIWPRPFVLEHDLKLDHSSAIWPG